MSQADVTVVTQLVLDGAQYAQDLEAAAEEARAFVESLNGGPGIMLPVGVDLARAEDDLYGFIRAYADTPIVLPVSLDLSRAEQQLAEFAERSGLPSLGFGGPGSPPPVEHVSGPEYRSASAEGSVSVLARAADAVELGSAGMPAGSRAAAVPLPSADQPEAASAGDDQAADVQQRGAAERAAAVATIEQPAAAEAPPAVAPAEHATPPQPLLPPAHPASFEKGTPVASPAVDPDDEPVDLRDVPPEHRHLYDPASTVSSVPSDHEGDEYVGPRGGVEVAGASQQPDRGATVGAAEAEEAGAVQDAAASAKALSEAQQAAAEALTALADQVRQASAGLSGSTLDTGAARRDDDVVAVPEASPTPATDEAVVAPSPTEPPAAPAAGEGDDAQSSVGEAEAGGAAEAAGVVAEAAEAYATALAEAAALITASAANAGAALDEAATVIGPVAAAMEAVIAGADLLATAEDAAVTALSPVAAAVGDMANAAGGLTAEMQASLNGMLAMGRAQQAATQALQQLANAAAQAAANTGPGGGPGGPGAPGGGRGGDAGTFAAFNPATQQTVPLAFNPATRQFFNTENGMGMDGVAWPGFENAGRAAAGGGGAAGGGNRMGAGFGRLMSGYFAVRGALDVGEAGLAAFHAGSSTDPAEQAKFIKEGQADVGRLPLVGPIISGLGEGIYRGISATGNAISGRGFESDAAYGERVAASVKGVDDAVIEESTSLRGSEERDRGLEARKDDALLPNDYERRKAERERQRAEEVRKLDAEQQKKDQAAEKTRKAKEEAALKSVETFGDKVVRFRVNSPISDVPGLRDFSRNMGHKLDDDIHDKAQPAIDAGNRVAVNAERSDQAERNRQVKLVDAAAAAEQKRDDAAEADRKSAAGYHLESQRAELVGDRVTIAKDAAEQRVIAETARIRATQDASNPTAAEDYRKGLGQQTIDRAVSVATVDDEVRHSAAGRQSASLTDDARDTQLRRTGQTDEAIIDAENKAQQRRIEEANDRLKQATAGGNQKDIEDATQNLKATREDAEQHVSQTTEDVHRDRADTNAKSADSVTDLRAAAEEAALRANGQNYEADTRAFNQAQDDKIKKLEELKAHAKDAGQKVNIQVEIDETRKTNKAEAASRDAGHAREDDERRGDIEERTRETVDRDKGWNYSAQLERLQHEAEADFVRLKKEGASQETIRARVKEHDADTDAAGHQNDRRYDRMREDAADTLLRSAGRGGEADIFDIRRDVAEQERLIDPIHDKHAEEHLADVKAYGVARVAAVTEQYKPKTEFGLNNLSYYAEMQERAVSGQHLEGMYKAANAATADFKKSDLQHPVDVDPGKSLAGLDKSSEQLRDAAKYLMDNTKKLYVAGGSN